MRLLATFIIFALSFSSRGYSNTSPESEDTDGDGFLDQNELIEYLLKRDESITYADIAAKKGDTFEEKKERFVKSILLELEEPPSFDGFEGGRGFGKPPPYSIRELYAWEHSQDENVSIAESLEIPEEAITTTDNSEEFPKLQAFLTEPIEKGDKTYGRPKIRSKIEDWSENNLKKVDGATIAFERDRLDSTDTWAGAGSAIYPIRISRSSSQTALLPSISWNLADESDGSSNDLQELKFGVPVTWRNNFGSSKFFYQNVWRTYLNPFYLTDLNFDGGATGISLTTDPHLQFTNFSFPEIGSLAKLHPDLPTSYRFRVIPKLEYAHVHETSEFIKRTSDEEFFAGGASLELISYPLGSSFPLQLTFGYSYLRDFVGDESFDLWKAKCSWWFDNNIGLTASFSDGDAPVSDQNIDQILVGLEVKY